MELATLRNQIEKSSARENDYASTREKLIAFEACAKEKLDELSQKINEVVARGEDYENKNNPVPKERRQATEQNAENDGNDARNFVTVLRTKRMQVIE
jgi:hypothetical protein